MKNKYEKKIIDTLIKPLVHAAAEERPKNQLESQKHYAHRLQSQLTKALHDFEKRLKAGVSALDQHKKWPHDERLNKVALLLKDKHDLEMQSEQPKTLQEILEFSDEELVDFYAVGKESYERANYQEAGNIFVLLTQLNPKVGSFWSALGAAEEMNGDIEGASHAYIFGSELEMKTLAPYLHGAQCLVKLNKLEEAKKLLNRAIQRGTEEQQLHSDLDAAKELLKSIS